MPALAARLRHLHLLNPAGWVKLLFLALGPQSSCALSENSLRMTGTLLGGIMPNSVTTMVTYSERQRAKRMQQQQQEQQLLLSNMLRESQLRRGYYC